MIILGYTLTKWVYSSFPLKASERLPFCRHLEVIDRLKKNSLKCSTKNQEMKIQESGYPNEMNNFCPLTGHIRKTEGTQNT